MKRIGNTDQVLVPQAVRGFDSQQWKDLHHSKLLWSHLSTSLYDVAQKVAGNYVVEIALSVCVKVKVFEAVAKVESSK
jgi:hypothetical protein